MPAFPYDDDREYMDDDWGEDEWLDDEDDPDYDPNIDAAMGERDD
jgi:hypothetical protein